MLSLVTLWACTSSNTDDLFGDPSAAASGGGPSGGQAGSSGSGGGSAGTTGGGTSGGGVSGSAGTTGGGAGTGSGATGGSGGAENGGAAGEDNGGTGGDPVAGAGGEAAAGGGQGGVPGCEPGAVSDEICDGLDNDCSGVADDDGTCPEGCAGASLDGRGYMLCDHSVGLTFSQAEAACQAESSDMHLVWIESELENAFLAEAGDEAGIDGAPVWIGASDAGSDEGVAGGAGIDQNEGQWFWVPSGDQFWDDNEAPFGSRVEDRYEKWGSGQPNENDTEGDPEDCAGMTITGIVSNATWNDIHCEEPRGYICEVRAL